MYMNDETVVIISPGIGLEQDSRAGIGLNCAARISDRECKRAARKGDYCLQHWLINYGHQWNLLTLTCPCGASWDKDVPEICPAKIRYIRVSLPAEVED